MIKKNLIQLLVLITLPVICYSQQASIGYIQHFYTGYNYSSTYNSKFRIASSGPVLFDNNTAFYHSKKVKKVEVLSSNKTVIWRLELDTAGTVLVTGWRSGGYFVEKEEYFLNANEQVRIFRYFDEHRLVRKDSITLFHRYYENEDTVIEYESAITHTYIIGEVINDRNRYYNQNYLNKEIERNVTNSYSLGYININYQGMKPQVYFDTPFKTNYDSLQMYHSLFQGDAGWVNGYLKSTKNSLEIDNNTQHPFIQNRHSETFENCLVDGECFYEPIFSGYANYSIDNRNYDYNNGNNPGYFYDENGLISEYYLDFYPEDTAATNQAKRNAKADAIPPHESAIFVAQNTPYFHNVVREEKPIRLETYYFRYEYFEE